MIEAEKIVRDAFDKPAPPDPPEPSEDWDDENDGHVCRPPALVVFADGGISTTMGGTVLLGLFVAGTMATAYLILHRLWAWLVVDGLWSGFVSFTSGFAWFFVGGLLGSSVLTWWQMRRARA